MEKMSKEEIEIYRRKLLKLYHAKKEELEFAEDNMEEHWIEEDMEKYKVKIKACVTKIRELESVESTASTSA
ncbi:MAG: hypothetical protein U9R26_05955 [Campylobacterota bacterium]|nr:hypothetical protein [Campylobacterota bacterium]